MNTSRFVVTLLCALMLISCANDDKHRGDLIAQQLQEVGELATQEVILTKLVPDAGTSVLNILGKKKIVFTMTAYYEVGIDLKEFNRNNIMYNKAANAIRVTLPPVKVLNSRFPIDEIEIEYENVSGVRFSFSPEDREKMYKACQDLMESAIREDVKENAVSYQASTVGFFESLLMALGYDEVSIDFEEGDID